MDTCVCMAESLHCSPETIRALLIDYNTIQNKKVLLKRKLKVKQTKSKTNQIIWAYVTQDGESTTIFMFLRPFWSSRSQSESSF